MQTIGSSQIFSPKIELWPFISQDEKARLLLHENLTTSTTTIARQHRQPDPQTDALAKQQVSERHVTVTKHLLACRTIVVTLKPLIDTVSIRLCHQFVLSIFRIFAHAGTNATLASEQSQSIILQARSRTKELVTKNECSAR